MDETKVSCKNKYSDNCSRLVVPSEATDTDGLCIPCWKAWLKSKYGPGISHTVRLRTIGIPLRIEELLLSCEEHCVLPCCGFNAVELSRENIRRWHSGLSDEARREFLAQFRQLLVSIAASYHPVLVLGDKYTVDEFYDELQPLIDFVRDEVKDL